MTCPECGASDYEEHDYDCPYFSEDEYYDDEFGDAYDDEYGYEEENVDVDETAE